MTAKRTLREIRRMAAATKLVLDTARRLGVGKDRHIPVLTTLKKSIDYTTLPAWRKAYTQGYAEGASAILSMIDSGEIVCPHAEEAPVRAKAKARPVRPMKQLPDAIPSTLPPPPPVPHVEPAYSSADVQAAVQAALAALQARH